MPREYIFSDPNGYRRCIIFPDGELPYSFFATLEGDKWSHGCVIPYGWMLWPKKMYFSSSSKKRTKRKLMHRDYNSTLFHMHERHVKLNKKL